MSLVLTRIQNLRATSNMDKDELRPSRYGALNLFRDQTGSPTSIITQELVDKARVSIGAPALETPVLTKDQSLALTSGGARTVVLPDYQNTSRMLAFTFIPYSWSFSIYPAQFMNNEIAIQKDFNWKFMSYLYKFAETLDKTSAALLSANSSTVCANPLSYNWSTTNLRLEAPYVERDNILGDVNPVMASNDFYGRLHLIGNTSLESLVRKLWEHDLYNEVNKSFEYQDKTFHFTNNYGSGDVSATGAYFKFMAVEEGSVGMLTRFERECILGTSTPDGHEWGITALPLINVPVGTYSYVDVVNAATALGSTDVADMTRNRREAYGFAVEVCLTTAFVSDYNRTTSGKLASPIMEFAVLKQPAPSDNQTNYKKKSLINDLK